MEELDVVIVGARCAGSPLAIQLAQAGLSVAVIDKDEFPSDTPSTHFFQAEGLASLARLGVFEELKATGAPIIEMVHGRIEDVVMHIPWPTRPGDVGGAMCVRRPLLDTILVERAREAGAEVRSGTKVVALVTEGSRIGGVRIQTTHGAEVELRARLVVGADGRGSIVARQAAARMYNVTANERFGYWGYYESVSNSSQPTGYLHQFGEEFLIGSPTDSGLFLLIVLPPLERLSSFKADGDRSFDQHLAKDEVLADVVSGGRRVGRLCATLGFTAYFRESAGPGWVLVGDAGHFLKDPSPAQGISDALRQVDKLAPAIIEGLGRSEATIDETTQRWWRWRDQDALEMYWFAQDFGRAGPVPAVFVEMAHRLQRQGRIAELMDIFNHRMQPSKVLTPRQLLGATGHLLRRGDSPRSQVLREVRELMGREVHRQRLNHSPRYQTAELVVAGEP